MSPTLNNTVNFYLGLLTNIYNFGTVYIPYTQNTLFVSLHEVASFSGPPSIQLLTGYKGKAWSVFSHECLPSLTERVEGFKQA